MAFFDDLVLPPLSPATGSVDAPPSRQAAVEAKTPTLAPVAAPCDPEAAPAVSAALLARLAPAGALYERLSSADYYSLLGIEIDATSKEVRRAYFGLSKKFHPDVFFRQPIGDYRRKLEAVFDALTRAYETLKSDEARAQYNAEHGFVAPAREAVVPSAPSARSVRPKVVSVRPQRLETEAERAERVLRQREKLRRSLPRPLQPQVKAPAGVTGPPPEPTTGLHPAREAQEALLRELGRLSRDPGRATGTRARPSAAEPGTKAAEAPLLALAMAFEVEGTGVKRWAAGRLRAAHDEELAGHLLDAANLVRIVSDKVTDERVSMAVDRLSRAAVAHTAQDLRTRARSAERSRDFAAAAEQWMHVAYGLPLDVEAHLQAARALLEAGRVSDAGRYALRAVELAPEAALPREVLILFFEAIGMALNAKRERATLKRIRSASSG